MEVGSLLASGGITGAIVACAYIGYKILYKRKIQSKCCCGELNMTTEPEAPPTVITVASTPQQPAAQPKTEPEPISV